MLANRSNLTTAAKENETDIGDVKKVKVDENPPNKPLRRGLGLLPANVLSAQIKPKALQASTNTIQSKQAKFLNNQTKNESKYDEPLKKKQTPVASIPLPKIDENNDVDLVYNYPYDALSDICPFDEVLYEKVRNLELADDGFGCPFDGCKDSEPFDF